MNEETDQRQMPASEIGITSDFDSDIPGSNPGRVAKQISVL